MSWLREALRGLLPPEKLRLVPKGFERLGHVALISLPEELLPDARLVGNKLLEVGGVKTVALRLGPIEGWQRKPRIKVIAGSAETVTLHREGGCWFKLDVAEVMFSKGNTHERQRIPKLVRTGEVVVDLFAGIGQFSIPIAKRADPERVYAVEKNRVAYGYLCENIRINRLGHRVVPLQGDCLEVAPRGVADRVIMGILHAGHRYLPLALEVLKPEGGVVHYHEASPCRLGFQRAVKRIQQAADGREIRILEKRVVKRYSPGVDHVVIDVWVGPSDFYFST
jgi:tRNA wybutosine-synthesizing protein 2